MSAAVSTSGMRNRSRVFTCFCVTLLYAFVAGAEITSPLPTSKCREILGADTVEALPLTYHVMPMVFRTGIEGIENQLGNMQTFSKALWLGACNIQVQQKQTHCTPNGPACLSTNDHGYWPAHHGRIDPVVGGDAAFSKLLEKAQNLNVPVFFDAVIGHYGYLEPGEKVFFNGQWVTRDELGDNIRPDRWIQQQDWEEFEAMTYPGEGMDTRSESFRQFQRSLLDRQDQIFTKLQLFGLPGFKHDHPAVQKHLIDVYKGYIDQGISGFRVDAALYVERSFLATWINELNAYAAQKGRKLTFILEVLVAKDVAMKAIMEDVLAKVHDSSRVYFLDFPMMFEFRRAENKDYSLAWLLGFMGYRKALSFESERLVPTSVNHDFGQIMHDPFAEKMIYTISDFMSHQPSVLFHGTEQSGQMDRNRDVISHITPYGDLGRFVHTLTETLQPYRNEIAKFKDVETLLADQDTLILRKNARGRSLILVINRAPKNLNQNFRLHLPSSSQMRRPLLSEDQSGSTHTSFQIHTSTEAGMSDFDVNVQAEGNTILALEFTHP